MFKKILVGILLCIPVLHLQAQIRITEIMYDVPGTDSGREWVEIYNDSDQSVDLSEYKILENDVNHKLVVYPEGSSAVIPSKTYAVIASDVAKFLIDNTYTGLIFDSVFSLNNSGESLGIVDPEGSVVDSVTYNPEIGGKGTGNTLQSNDGVWIVAEKTPGLENSTVNVDEGREEDVVEKKESNTTESTHSGVGELTEYEDKEELKIGSGRDRYGLINTPMSFISTSNIDKGVKYQWSFGDGGISKGQKTEHTYYYPGEYNVVLNGSDKEGSAVSRSKVYIKEPIVEIMLIKRGEHVDVMLKNLSDFEVNLGEFYLILEGEEGNQKFKIPQDTILSSKSDIYIPGRISKLKFVTKFELRLKYPNSELLDEYGHMEYLDDVLAKYINDEGK